MVKNDMILKIIMETEYEDIDSGQIYLKSLNYYVKDILYIQKYYQQITLPSLNDKGLIRIRKY